MALLAAWVVLAFGALAHADGHAHRFCAEHGTIEEGEALASHLGGPGVEGRAEVGAESEVRSLLRAAAKLPGAPEAHAECPLATLPGRDALDEVAGAADQPERTWSALRSLSVASSHAPLSPLTVAPKASPPAV